ncbi:DNA repair protein RecN [Demequina sp. B12]|uniref:DNA repair protein RecN n=1 Tax=Demequina sp. B12 TaxID=2992757 RepID=UPI00237B48FC|nr:DNA repair protein RecN [Demequina sp. B12]MDE0573247.1 DNA repair protein RecN [Demequina sp. B12]
MDAVRVVPGRVIVLHELSIADLGVIESARIELGPGLTCVTGETGAGKTMVLTGLGLILGAKSVRATVREGAREALAEAVMDVPQESESAARLDDAGVVVDDDGTVVVARTVGAETRSRTVVGGRTVPQALLAEVAAELVTVHGQSDQARLRSGARQRDTLDEYAGAPHSGVMTKYAHAWQAWKQATAELAVMEEGAQAERAEVARLRDDVAAIDEISPQPDEDTRIESQIRVLENAESVRLGVAAAHEALAGDQDFTAAVALENARKSLSEAAMHDESLAALEKRVADFAYGAADVATELSSYLDGMDAESASLNELHERRSDLASLMRRIGVIDVAAVVEYAERARPRIALDDDWDATLESRRKAVAETLEALESAAVELRESRLRASAELAAAVQRELAELAMPDARVGVEVVAAEPAAHGADTVTFTLAAHPGAAHRPLAEAASGGELSRVMLALEVALAEASSGDRSRTFVFDEVDAGVGGRAALAVGNRLAQLARTHQVVVVTHLAQVAAYADTHVVVAKSTDGSVTKAQVHVVDGEARVEEVARLLSGQESSTTALAHALELLEGSRVAR